MLFSDSKFHYNNIKFIVCTLLNNDYPAKFVFNTINIRLKYWFNKKLFSNNIPNDDIIMYLDFCYHINSMSEKFLSICKDINIKLAFFSDNKLNRFIKVQKDALSKFGNKNVIYKICCKDCDASYMGQTYRKLSSRIFEHHRHIN